MKNKDLMLDYVGYRMEHKTLVISLFHRALSLEFDLHYNTVSEGFINCVSDDCAFNDGLMSILKESYDLSDDIVFKLFLEIVDITSDCLDDVEAGVQLAKAAKEEAEREAQIRTEINLACLRMMGDY